VHCKSALEAVSGVVKSGMRVVIQGNYSSAVYLVGTRSIADTKPEHDH